MCVDWRNRTLSKMIDPEVDEFLSRAWQNLCSWKRSDLKTCKHQTMLMMTPKSLEFFFERSLKKIRNFEKLGISGRKKKMQKCLYRPERRELFECRVQEVFAASEITVNRFIRSRIFLVQRHSILQKCPPTCETSLFPEFPTPEKNASFLHAAILECHWKLLRYYHAHDENYLRPDNVAFEVDRFLSRAWQKLCSWNRSDFKKKTSSNTYNDAERLRLLFWKKYKKNQKVWKLANFEATKKEICDKTFIEAETIDRAQEIQIHANGVFIAEINQFLSDASRNLMAEHIPSNQIIIEFHRRKEEKRFMCSWVFVGSNHINLQECVSTGETALFPKWPTLKSMSFCLARDKNYVHEKVQISKHVNIKRCSWWRPKA